MKGRTLTTQHNLPHTHSLIHANLSHSYALSAVVFLNIAGIKSAAPAASQVIAAANQSAGLTVIPD